MSPALVAADETSKVSAKKSEIVVGKGRSIALVGGRIQTLSSQGVITGDVLIRDGRIAAVGKDIKIPPSAQRIDVAGMIVTPGLIDVRSTLWLSAAAAKEGSSKGELSVLDGVDPFLKDWREVARQGVTTVYVQPASSGILGGSGAVLRVAPAPSIEQLVIAANAGAQASLGVGGKTTTSRDRHAQYASLKKTLEAAKKYDDDWKAFAEFEKKKAADAKSKKSSGTTKTPSTGSAKPASKKAADSASEKNTTDAKASTTAAKSPAKPDDKTTKPPTKPKRDSIKEFLRKVIQRKVPLRLEAHRQDDVSNALKLAKELKIRVVLEGVSKAGGSLNPLLESRLPMVLGPFAEMSTAPSYRKGRDDDWALPLARNDARWAIGTFSAQPRGSRLLRAHAALAVAAGVEPAMALRAITKDAAEIVGIGEQAGTIAVGKRADLAVFAGQPLDPSTRVVLAMSAGEITHQIQAAAPRASVPSVTPLPATLPESYAIRSQRVLRDGQLRPATLIIRNAKIVGIRDFNSEVKNLAVFDLGSGVVTPGLISPHSELGQSALIDDAADSVTPDIRAADAFDPTLSAWSDFYSAGFLTIGFSPGSKNVVSGLSAIARTDSHQGSIATPIASLKLVMTSTSRQTSRYPGSLAGQMALLRQVFGGALPPTRLLVPMQVEAELVRERKRSIALAKSGQRRVIIAASERPEIQAAIDLIDEFKLRATLLYPNELEPFVDDLKRLDIGVIAKTVKDSDYDRYLEEVVNASNAGVAIAFGGDSPADCRMSAALAVSMGMSRQSALSSLTDTAARLAGAGKLVGKLAAKQPADFVVWDGSPLDLRRKPINIVVGGRLQTTNK